MPPTDAVWDCDKGSDSESRGGLPALRRQRTEWFEPEPVRVLVVASSGDLAAQGAGNRTGQRLWLPRDGPQARSSVIAAFSDAFPGAAAVEGPGVVWVEAWILRGVEHQTRIIEKFGGRRRHTRVGLPPRCANAGPNRRTSLLMPAVTAGSE